MSGEKIIQGLKEAVVAVKAEGLSKLREEVYQQWQQVDSFATNEKEVIQLMILQELRYANHLLLRLLEE